MKLTNQLNSYQRLLSLGLSADESPTKLKEIEQLFTELDNGELFEKAHRDEVATHLAYKVKKYNGNLTQKWLDDYTKVDVEITNLLSELERVAKRLQQDNIRIVALKNAGITTGIYKVPSCSPMGDIDLLVSTNDFHKAHEILISDLGYTFEFRSDLEDEDLEEAFKSGGTEYCKDVNGYKVWLELQWRPVAGRWIQPHNEPNGNELIARAIPIENSSVHLLSPEDNLLQVCLHTAKHSYCRAPGFRLHSDVDRIVRFTDINWTAFVEQVKKMKLKTAVYYSLIIPRDILETPIPVKVIQQLRPGFVQRMNIERLLNKAGLFNQNKKKFSKVGYIIFNMSLYDSLGEVLTAIFPPSKVMKKRYEFSTNILLPYYHFKRIISLVLKRAKL